MTFVFLVYLLHMYYNIPTVFMTRFFRYILRMFCGYFNYTLNILQKDKMQHLNQPKVTFHFSGYNQQLFIRYSLICIHYSISCVKASNAAINSRSNELERGKENRQTLICLFIYTLNHAEHDLLIERS